MNFDYKWILSDTHFAHSTMIKAKWRPEGWQGQLWDNWNRLIQPNDKVLHLGDVVFGGKPDLMLLKELPGDITFIKGNHDSSQRVKDYQNKLGWKFIDPFVVEYEGYDIEFRHEPTWPLPANYLQVHGHIHMEPEVSLFHLNCCVEHLNFAPVELQGLVDARIEKLHGLLKTRHLLLVNTSR